LFAIVNVLLKNKRVRFGKLLLPSSGEQREKMENLLLPDFAVATVKL
jgi:hypothetical protein